MVWTNPANRFLRPELDPIKPLAEVARDEISPDKGWYGRMVGENAGPIREVRGRLHDVIQARVAADSQAESPVIVNKARQLRPGRRTRRHREQRTGAGD